MSQATDLYSVPLRNNPQRAEREVARNQNIDAPYGKAQQQEVQTITPPNKFLPRVSIEYQAPHWFIITKAPSGKWEALCDATKKVNLYNAFGDVIFSKPAIKTFVSYQQAFEHLTKQMPGHRLTKRNGFFTSLGNMLNPFQQ